MVKQAYLSEYSYA